MALHEIGHALGLVQPPRPYGSNGNGDYWLRPAFVSRFGVTEGVFSETLSSHLNLPGDIMSNDGSWLQSDVTSLSAVVLENLGYRVDYAAVEDFVVPSAKPVVSHWCGIGP